MPFVLDIDIRGLEDLADQFNNIDQALDPEAVLDEAGAILLNRVRTRFIDQVNPDGTAWPVSQAALRRQALGRGGGTLFETGSMFQSIDLFAGGERERKISFDPRATRRGRDTFNRPVKPVPVRDYAGFAQDGPPARIVMGFSVEDAQVVNALLVRRFEEAAGG